MEEETKIELQYIEMFALLGETGSFLDQIKQTKKRNAGRIVINSELFYL